MKNIGFMALLLKLAPMFLKFIKSVKVIKVALAGGSMAAYSYLFTWQFAVILISSIVFHEYGHIRGMKKCGIKTKGIFLIPFMGGAAVSEDEFKTRRDETYVALMGPLYGFYMTIPFMVYGILYNSPLAIGLVSFMALINLFNLLPINPLDGGRVVKSMAFSLNSGLGLAVMVIGMLFAAGLVWYFGIWLLVVIIAIGVIELFFEYLTYKKEREGRKSLRTKSIIMTSGKVPIDTINGIDKLFEEKNMSKKEIIKYSINYIALVVVFLGLIIYAGQFEGADLALKIIQDKI